MDIKRRFLKGFIIFTALFFCYSIFAAKKTTPTKIPTITPPAAEKTFNVEQANRTLDKLGIQLSIQNLNIKDLQNAVDVLTALQIQAKECVKQSQEDINEVGNLWEETKAETKSSKKLTTAQKYLQDKEDTLKQRRSECRLFVLRSDEAIIAFSKTAKQLSTKKLLETKPNFWKKITSGTKATQELYEKFSNKIFMRYSGLNSFNKTNTIIFTILLIIGIAIGFFLKSLANKSCQYKQVEDFADKFHLAFACTCSKYVVPFFILLVFSAFTASLDIMSEHTTYLSLISYDVLVYISALSLIHFLFHPFQSQYTISDLPKSVAKPLTTRLKLLSSLVLIGFIAYTLFSDQTLPPSAAELARTIFITFLTISLISILWLINRVPKLLFEHRVLRFFISLILTCGLLIILVAEWMGYQPLVTYILKSITLTLVAGLVAWLADKILISMIINLSQSKNPWQENLRKHLGVKKSESISEFIWIRIILYILIWGGFLLALLKIWVLSDTNFRTLIDALINGFKATGLEIVPSRILYACLFFIIVTLLLRWIRYAIAHDTEEKTEQGSHEAFAAIVSYVGISITLLIALLIAGVNFAGLAIIAGALSVGIGFGLQNIVNNFVSGIILLIERPIKPGDRIMIGDVEGFVRRISIRSTQIKTLQFSDLIVPNSEIISKAVTNLMFHDFYYRIKIEIGVAYGSNTEKVKKILLEIAEAHPEVVKGEGLYQSTVLFKKFGDSALIFNLICVLRNVNLKYQVESELHYAIDAAFRKNKISIAFPQQDVHIKEIPAKTIPKK